MGTFLKTMGAFGSVMRAGSKAGKGAKTEEGIATLGKQPMFTPEDTINLAYTPDGSFSPGIKDLIEKASPKLRGQGIVQWANKNLKPKELEVLGIEEFIKANPKATLRETVEGISGNKVVVGKKVLGGGEGQKMDFDITEPIDDPLTGAVLWDDIIGDTIYQLDDGDQYIQEDLVNYFNTLRAEKFVETGSEKGIPDKIYEFDELTGDKLEQLGLGKGSSMALDDLIESYAEAQYMSNPYELIRPTGVNVGDNTFAFGNEDTGLPNNTDYSDQALLGMVKDFQKWRKVRMIGSAAIASCYVASAKADVYKEFGTYIWDVAAGAAIVNASGGRAEITNQRDNFQVDVHFSNSYILD